MDLRVIIVQNSPAGHVIHESDIGEVAFSIGILPAPQGESSACRQNQDKDDRELVIIKDILLIIYNNVEWLQGNVKNRN